MESYVTQRKWADWKTNLCFSPRNRRGQRRDAFTKLAQLSLQATAESRSQDFERLSQSLPKAPPQSNGYLEGVFSALPQTSRVPMTLRELDLLLALCASASKIQAVTDAERLVNQLSTYLAEAHTQVFAPSPFLSEIDPSPWAVVTFQLTHALLLLGTRFITIRATVAEAMQSYLNNWTQAASAFASQTPDPESEDDGMEAREVSAVAVSLVGFMEAAAMHYNFWDAFGRLQLVRTLKDSLSENYQQCGTRNATAEALSATAASASATSESTSGASGSGSATASGASATSSSSGAASPSNVAQLSTGAFAAILLAFFKLFL
jgi:hypothetical protein